MKNLYTLFTILILAGLTAFGQGKVDYDSRSKFYLGFNFGGTYHSNTEVDVNRLYRGGAGFTFGYSFGMKPQRLFSLDLQVRYLLAAYRGVSSSKYTLNANTNDVFDLNEPPIQPILDYENAYGYYVPNFHSWVNDWSLELKVNTNRLRERTGWNFFVLGGIGTTRYNTRLDLYDDGGNAGQVKPESELFERKIPLTDFETPVVNKRDWMPSFGMGIERQITPNAAFQIMGRMTWTRNNDFDGLANTFTGQASSSNDRYHYASAGIKFYLRGRANAYIEDDEDPIVTPNPNPPVQGQRPVARFTTPRNSPTSVSTSNYTLLALVQNVSGQQNITFIQNGRTISNYSYNANTDRLTYNAILIPGQNTFTVKGVNSYGSAQDQTVIVYKEVVNQLNPPAVTITNPNGNAVTVSNNNYAFTAQVTNVTSKQNITMYVNGSNYTNFNFNANSNQLTTNLNLVSGKNVVTVTGTNSAGSDSKTAEIIYRKVITGPPPVVKITSPSVNPFQTTANSASVSASVANVGSKNDITVKVNGVGTNNFSYAVNGQVNFNISLVQGNNIVEVKGVNQYGQDVASTTLIYQPTQTVQPPVVTIVSPSNGANYSVPTSSVKAKVLYVNSKNDISVYINGQSTSNFSYNSASKLVTFNASLIVGNNTLKVVGVNSDGQDQASVSVFYNKPVVLTPPVVTIIDPATDNKTYSIPAISAKATVLNVPSKSNISVLLNGNNISNFTFNTSTKVATIPLTLMSGNNTLVVSATNNDGSDSKQRIIRYKKAVSINPPTVQFTTPSISPVTVKAPTFNVKAKTTNVTSKNQIVLKQNGIVVNSSSYSFIGSTISYPSTLSLGDNTFNVVVTNTAGTDSKSTLIKYEKDVIPCTKPTIGYVAPSPNSTVSAANQNIEAQINNYVTGTTVTLKLNGGNLGSMAYNGGTQIANKSVTLKQGINTLEVTVSNDCGTNKSTFVLNYKPVAPPCLTPVVKITSSSAMVTNANYQLTSVVSNITSKNQIIIKLNGVSQPFSLSNGKVSANLTLQTGTNLMTVTAENSCGKDAKTLSVISKPCVAPKLVLISPLKTSITITAGQYDLKLNATGDVSQNDITVKLNGTNIPFSFNSVSKALTMKVNNLTNGMNTVQVSVKNACGSDVVNYKITANLCTSPQVILSSSMSSRLTTVSSLSYSFVATVKYMTTKNGIVLKLNNSAVPFNFNAATGKVTASMRLKEGSNTIILSATNSCGSDSKSQTITAKTCDIPKLTAVSPKATSSTTNSSQTFIVNTTGVANAKELQVRLNGLLINKSFVGGKLTVVVKNLKLGSNTLVITANNNCGSDKITFYTTRKPCNKPAVNLISTSTKVTTLPFSFSATVTGVSFKQDIVLKLNNKSVAFTYNAKTGKVVSNLTLIEGGNTITLTATNKCGVSKKTHTVTANTCKKPEIKVAYPTNTSITTANSTFTILAIGLNVGQSDIKVTNNGSSIPFTFNSSTGKITVAVSNMRQGANNIKIKGSNACGSSEVNYVLTSSGGSRSTGGEGKTPSSGIGNKIQKRN